MNSWCYEFMNYEFIVICHCILSLQTHCKRFKQDCSSLQQQAVAPASTAAAAAAAAAAATSAAADSSSSSDASRATKP
jgi:hypothetical protein